MTNKVVNAVPVNRDDKIIQARKSLLSSPIVMMLSSIIFTFLLVEGLFRLAIGFNVAYFTQPFHYSYPFYDNYWKLSYRWQQRPSETGSGNLQINPLLGWAPPVTPDNPLGVIAVDPYEPDSQLPAVLFYGDSFVAGKTDRAEDNIAHQLDLLLPEMPVYNYGVSNFGVDQIYLRLQQTHNSFAQPTMVVGIFTMDMDRSMLSLRSGAPKPHFSLDDSDSLWLNNIDNMPIKAAGPAWLERWHEEHPPQIPSYAGAFLMRRINDMRFGDNELNTTLAQDEIEALNGRLISEMVTIAEERNLPIQFVIFYTTRELDTTYWRESFLLNHLESLGVPVLDTKPLLLDMAKQENVPVEDYFLPDGAHTNELGNRVIAEALAEQIIEK